MPFTRMFKKETVEGIKVIGIGGGGGNTVNTMVENFFAGVQFIVADTDVQALAKSRADIRLQLGPVITKGNGAGTDPNIGQEAAQESYEILHAALKGSVMVFVITCLGGGTGTGAAPVIAKLSKKTGALTLTIVTKPFCFEAKTRKCNAVSGWKKLKEYSDVIVTVPNDKLLNLMNRNSTITDMLLMFDTLVSQAVKGIIDLVNLSGYTNLDIPDR